jgi:hypothetical protein
MNSGSYRALNYRIEELLAFITSFHKRCAPFEKVVDITADCCRVNRKSLSQYSTRSVVLPIKLHQDIHDQQLTPVACTAPLRMISAPTSRTFTRLFKGPKNPLVAAHGDVFYLPNSAAS